MGVFRFTLALGSPTRDRFEDISALVDTGAAYTWIPAPTLEQLGHKPGYTRRLRLADGSIIERPAADVPVRIGDEIHDTVCVFGDDGTEPLLGAITMEQFGLAPDPINHTLVPVVAYLV